MEYRKNATYQKLTSRQEMAIIPLMMLSEDFKLPENEMPFEMGVIKKRIDATPLDIEYTDAGLLLIVTLARRVGFCVLGLIDCMNILKPKGLAITPDNIAEHVYLDGFYTDDCASSIIDNWMKTKKAENSQIY